MGSQEVAGKGYINTEQSQMVCIGAIFKATYHTEQLKLISHPCGKLQGTDCLSTEIKPLKDHLSNCEHLIN